MKKYESYTRGLLWFMAMLLGILVTACGGSNSDQAPILGNGPGIVVLATVTAVSPLPGAASVPINTKTLTASFSKAMDASTLTASSFTLACPGSSPIAGGVVSYSAAGSIATLTLPVGTNLPVNTVCTATITNAPKDAAGGPLASSFAWSFTTSSNPDVTAPTVTATVAANAATNVARNTKVSATFSEAMNPSTISAATFSFKQGNVVVPGTLSFSGANLVFAPASPLDANATYTATITTGVTDLAGNPMASAYVWSWTTGSLLDTTAPTVTATIHPNGATNVPVNSKSGATFSESMDPLTVNDQTFLFKETTSGKAVAGTLGYSGVNAVFVPSTSLLANTAYTLTVKGGASGVKDLAGLAMVNDYTWSWTTGAADTIAPTVTQVSPADLAVNVATNTTVNASFSEAMDPLTVTTATFGVAGVTGTVAFNAQSNVATFTPSSALASGTQYTATVKGGAGGAADLAGNALTSSKVWTFTTATNPVVQPSVSLGSASSFGTFGGSAGMTNTGTGTIVNGSIGTTATGSSSITGFHDTSGDIYTETPANIGAVNGKIYSCTNSTTGPTSAGPNAASCAAATQARLDAQAAYLSLAAMAPGANPGANLANLTLAPGVYTSPSGSFLIEGGNLTLDAQGNAGAVWVFQMAQTLTVGGPGAAAPQSIILAGGAQAKNVYWQVGSFATINAGGGGTMVGTIISQAGASFSTAGNVATVQLQGRALSLGASVTLVNTVINLP